MGNCFKCLEKHDDQQQLIDSDDDVSSFGEEASSIEEEVPASERDEVYQRLQDALIHYDPPDILGRAEIQEKMDEYDRGLRDKIMNGIYVKNQAKNTGASPRMGMGDHGGMMTPSENHSSSGGASGQLHADEQQQQHRDQHEPEWEQMVKNIRDKIRTQGGIDKIEFVYAK